MKRILIVLFFLTALTKLIYSQGLDTRLLWYGLHPEYNYLDYPDTNPPPIWRYETNPPVLYDGFQQGNKPLQDPKSFYLWYRHDSRFLFYNYGILTPLMYSGHPDWPNPAIPRYFEPNYPPAGNMLDNYGPTIIIEFHISKALSIPIQTPFGKMYIDQGYYPYTVVQTLLPWHRLKNDTVDTIRFGVNVRRSTWKFSSQSFNNSIPLSWVEGGGFQTNSMRPLWFVDEQFSINRSFWMVPGDRFVCQAKVTYLFPYNTYNPDWLWGPYNAVYDVTFWSNPIFLKVPQDL